MNNPDPKDLAIRELTEAIRLTVEYVGNDTLPPIDGWSWYDALKKYDPESAKGFLERPVLLHKEGWKPRS